MKQWKRVSSALLAVILLAVMVLVNPNVTKASSRLETMTAFDLTNDIKIGWNLGNSLESTNITWISNPSVSQYETAWGNPVTTKAMIDEIKKAGFNTVRIPVTWDTKVGSAPNYTINADWMNRVQEVVNYAIDNGMYVILNSHHDTNWIIPKTSNQSTVTAKLSSIWKQIATRFQNYDEHLIFETLNEPRVIGDSTEWTGGTSEYRSVINAYNLAAVNAIRSTGGNNLYRFILIPTHGDSTAIAAMNDLVIPNNDKRCIVTLHMYSPYSFAMDKNGTSTWGSDYDKSSLDSDLDAIYNKFISKGIAVILGEFGSINKNNESSRVAHAAYYVKAAKIRQIPVIWWDNNSFAAGTGETFGLFNRNSLSWQFPTILSALMNAAATSTATPTPTPTTAPTATPTTAPTTAPTATPTVAPTTAPTNGSFALKSTLNSWGTGYTMNIDITNTSNSTVNGWTLTLNKADFTITNIWNAEMTVSGDSIIIKPLSWNSTLNPGSMASFGFQGNGTPVTNFNYTIK